MDDTVDLRSGTPTLPTAARRRQATVVGDDGWDLIFHADRPGGAAEAVAGVLARNVKIHQIGPASIRCVTHKDVERAPEALREITAGW